MYRFSEYLHIPEIAIAALLDRISHRIPASIVKFGSDSHQVAYFLRPRPSPSDEPVGKPIVIFIHGGGWRRGHPRFFRFVGRFFARLGYPCLIVGYRLGPSHTFEAQIQDLRAGISKFCSSYRLTDPAPRPVILVGQSAGGQLAAHLAYRENVSPVPVKAFVSISGVLSFHRTGFRYLERLIANTAPDPLLRREADAVHSLAGTPFPWLGEHGSYRGTEDGGMTEDGSMTNHTPTLVVHGMEDRIVPLEIAQRFASAYEIRNGTPPSLLFFPWAKHNELALLFLGRRPRASALLTRWLESLA